MKTMTLRVPFTLAILAGLAAAPDAQSFRWEPNSRAYDVGDRVERAFEQAERNIERQWRNVERLWDQRLRNAERISEQAQRNAERRADAIQREVRARVQRQINDQMRSYRYYAPRTG